MSFYLGDYNVGKFFIMIFLSIFMFGSFFFTLVTLFMNIFILLSCSYSS